VLDYKLNVLVYYRKTASRGVSASQSGGSSAVLRGLHPYARARAARLSGLEYRQSELETVLIHFPCSLLSDPLPSQYEPPPVHFQTMAATAQIFLAQRPPKVLKCSLSLRYLLFSRYLVFLVYFLRSHLPLLSFFSFSSSLALVFLSLSSSSLALVLPWSCPPLVLSSLAQLRRTTRYSASLVF
jgi:hypothetical protein